MNKKRPIFIIILLLYIFLPSSLRWIVDSEGSWYRPFIVWLAVIAIVFLLQIKRAKHDV